MPAARKTPGVVVLTEDDLRSFVEQIQKGFADLTAKIDALQERLDKPGLATAPERKKLAADALKAAVTRPTPRKRA